MAGWRGGRTGAMALASGRDRPRLAPLVLRQALPLLAVVLAAVLMRERFRAVDPGAVRDAVAQIAPVQWLCAAAATAVSFLALGRYDAVIHRYLRTGIPDRAARRSGMTAIALSQAAGFGLVTGALARWRMLPGLSLWQALRVTASVTVWFLIAWSVVTAAMLVALRPEGPLGAPGVAAAAASVLLLAAAGAGLSLVSPQIRIKGRSLALPPLPALARLLVYATIDTSAAALALWFLLPEGAAPAPAEVAAAYAVALGAGLILATPGGLGPFDLALMTFLPATSPDGLLAAILAFRIVYFVCPALVAIAALARGPLPQRRGGPSRHARGRLSPAGAPLLLPATVPAFAEAGHLIAGAARAECGLLRQGEHHLLAARQGRDGWVVGRGGQALAALFDPVAGTAGAALLIADLAAAARAEDRVPCLYKCSARTAAAARRLGWAVRPVAREQVVAPSRTAGFSGPAFAGLRRKLRKAAEAGITVEPAAPGSALPLAEMAAIAARWAAARGGERGFSMGRFAPFYVGAQRVWLARAGGRIVAFATFHEGGAEWVLDLMRWDAGAPDGTMHALVARATGDAAGAGVGRVSLAALPCPPRCGPARRLFLRLGGAEGLARFKSAFAPRAETLYIAAPSWPALGLALADILRAVHRPGPLPMLPAVLPSGLPAVPAQESLPAPLAAPPFASLAAPMVAAPATPQAPPPALGGDVPGRAPGIRSPAGDAAPREAA
ncbi:phosphatidylglycerol lysyltransferase domain-containing protein [Albidovulum sp.]|uniref:phosphatidylglycerol lysyltransferase domain-containing protein n=1 Tax=Albidovulum sp. TaxID=1872424 RepID=UPI003050846A